MSDFDKYVAQWVSRAGDELSKEAREQLLTNIHNSLGDYETLRDPEAARAHKEAAEKSKQREEENRKKEEQDRRRQERQANLPPLPPSKSNTETMLGANAGADTQDAAKLKKKKKAATRKDGAAAATPGGSGARAARGRKAPSASAPDLSSQENGAEGTSSPPSAKTRASHKIPYSKEGGSRTARPRKSGTVPVKDIDFKFGARVDEQLRKLETEKPVAKTTIATAPAATASKTKARIPPAGGTDAAAPASTAAPAPAPVSASISAPVSAADAKTGDAAAANAQKAGRKRSSPPPLDQVVVEEEEQQAAEAAAEREAALSHGSDTANHEKNDCNELLRNHSRRSSSTSSSSSKSIPSLGNTRNYQEHLKAFHFASVGDEKNGNGNDKSGHGDGKNSNSDGNRSNTDENAEEEFIDDHEDVRRRTMQMQRPSRPAISDSVLDIDEACIANFPTTPKSQNKVKTISRVLVRHFLFSTLDDSDIARFASIMDLEHFEAGDKILTKGELNDTFYIILDGEAETTELNDAGEEVVVRLLRDSTCGDVALMYEVRNEATVIARTSVQCATLERRTYKMIVSRAMEEKRKKYVDFLSSIPLFHGLSSSELEHVAQNLKEDTYVEGQKIIAYGVPNHWLHIVMEGTLRVVSPDVDDGKEKEVVLVHRGQFVGEIEFIYHHLPVAAVFAASPVVKTAKLSRRSFEVLPSTVRERLVHIVDDDETYKSYHQHMHSASPPALDTTPPFDAPPLSVQKSMRQYESEQSETTSRATSTPPPPPPPPPPPQAAGCDLATA